MLNSGNDLTFVTTGADSALHFNGGYVDVPGFGNLAPTNEITLEFWQRVSTAGLQSTVDLFPDQVPIPTGLLPLFHFMMARFIGILVYLHCGTSCVLHSAGSYYQLVATLLLSWPVSQATTHGHLPQQHAGSPKTNMTPFVRGNYDLIFGALLSTNPPQYYVGDLDEVRIWNVARSAGQIQSNFDRSLVGNEPGLVAYWRFDEGAGTAAFDDSGHAQTGNLINSNT